MLQIRLEWTWRELPRMKPCEEGKLDMKMHKT